MLFSETMYLDRCINMNDLVEIRNDSLEVSIDPVRGALVTRFFSVKDNFNILKPAQGKMKSVGMFSLIPYSNRIRGGSFVYWGIKRNVPKNRNDITDPIHGDGWLSEWKVINKTENSVELSFTHDKKDGFPFSYIATKKYTLKNDKLCVNISIKNIDDLPMPCGMGVHPHFNKDGRVLLKFKNRTIWADENALSKQIPHKTDAVHSFENGKELDDSPVDICFGGFDGHAEIDWLDKDFTLNIDAHEDFNHIVLYSPKDSDFFCLEPATNANDAFNLASHGITGTGIQTIEPDEVLEGKIEFRLCHKK